MASAPWASKKYQWSDPRIRWDGTSAVPRTWTPWEGMVRDREPRVPLSDPGRAGEPWHGRDDCSLSG